MVPNMDKYWLLAGPWTVFMHVWSLNQSQTRKSRTDVWTYVNTLLNTKINKDGVMCSYLYCKHGYFRMCKCSHYATILTHVGCSFCARQILVTINNVWALIFHVDKFVQVLWCVKSANINVAWKFPCLQYSLIHFVKFLHCIVASSCCCSHYSRQGGTRKECRTWTRGMTHCICVNIIRDMGCAIWNPYTPCGKFTTSIPQGECGFQMDFPTDT